MSEFDYGVISSCDEEFLVVSPNDRQRNSLLKTIDTVHHTMVDKLRLKVQGKRVAWRRPREVGPETFALMRKNVETLSAFSKGQKANELFDAYWSALSNCWETFIFDGDFGTNADDIHKHFHCGDPIRDLYSMLDDRLVESNASRLEREYPSEWAMAMELAIDGARPNVLSPAALRIETARDAWCNITSRAIIDSYVCAVVEQSHKDGNLISLRDPPPELRGAMPSDPQNFEYRVMLSRKLQEMRKSGCHFHDIYFNDPCPSQGERYKRYRDWVDQQRSSESAFHVEKRIICAEDPNVLFDFKMRFG